MDINQTKIDLNREIVLDDYNSATKKNKELFLNGDVKATSEYIYPNQKEDSSKICNIFHNTTIRVISIIKKTKVGMDGLMIEIAKDMSTHPDNDFCIPRNHIFFITGMSNISWENDMKNKIPNCFKDNVYHHGKLNLLMPKLINLKNVLIIIDEIDCGDKVDQKLYKVLKKCGILDMKYMQENNIRFIFVSATMLRELVELDKWGDKHHIHYMTIPDTYIGHKEFLELDIIQEYYPINNNESAEKWVQEDILNYYGSDYRVHIIRIDKNNKDFIYNACIRHNIEFKNHTSATDERISDEDFSYMFNNITKHIVIAVKGLFRRANLIPNEWKIKIGAIHEKYVKNYDTNVQVQGLPGRMSGYWKQIILNGHKTGPYRTSIDSMNEYEDFYKNTEIFKNDIKDIKYSTSGSKKIMVDPVNIKHLEYKDDQKELKEPIIKKFKTQEEAKIFYNKVLKYKIKPKDKACARGPNKKKPNEHGYYEAIIRRTKKVYSCEEMYKDRKCNIENGAGYGFRPCYENVNDKSTLQWWFIYYES